jgi:hypothetical protein
MSSSASWYCPTRRWLLYRLKRVALTFSLLLLIVVISCSGFLFLNSDAIGVRLAQTLNGGGAGLAAAAGRGAGGVTGDGQNSRGFAPNVQFYPDNQNKLLFRKANNFYQHETWMNNGEKKADSYASLVREKLSAVRKIEGKTKRKTTSQYVVGSNSTVLSYNVHMFYYAWYGTPKFDDGKWHHWNHEYIKNWDKRSTVRNSF